MSRNQSSLARHSHFQRLNSHFQSTAIEYRQIKNSKFLRTHLGVPIVLIRDTKLVFSRALALLAAKDLNKLLRRGGVPVARLLLLIFMFARLMVEVLVCK